MGAVGRRWRGLALLAAAVAVSLAGCFPGGGMSYAENKQRVADIVDATYAATMAGKPASPGGEQPAVPCLSAGGTGAATGDYGPKGDIEVALGGGVDLERLVERVTRYWEREGYEITLVNKNSTVLARAGDYGLSLRISAEGDRARIGATGPCATPESEAQREELPPFKSIARKGAAPETGRGQGGE